MNNWVRIGCVLVLMVLLHAAQAAGPLPRSAPEAQGVSSAALLEWVNALDQQIEGMHSVMIVRHGRVIAEGWWTPYDAQQNHVLYSLSKSFTSTAVGLAVAEGKLRVDDPVLKFFPEDAPADASEHLKAMRVRDLLTMSTGHQEEPPMAPDTISAKSFLAQAVPRVPGTHFKYNTPATFMQSAIVQKVTGQTVLDFLRPRLFEPLGIEYPVWDANFQGISLGGYGLRVRTEDIARFGQLYLGKGRWNGRQLLPAEWVAMATARQVANGTNANSDWNQGYGFQFWRCRHNAFRGDGAFGQYCVVLPEPDAVVAITSGIKDMQAPLNLIWDKLLPAFRSEALPANPAAAQQLKDKLAHLEVRPAAGAATSPCAARVMNRTFAFPANDQQLETLTLSSPDAGQTLVLAARRNGQELKVPCGYGEWKRGRAPFSAPLAQFPDEPTAGTFAWSGENTCIIKLCAYETPFHTTLTLAFNGDQVTVSSEANVSFGPTKRAPVSGRAEEWITLWDGRDLDAWMNPSGGKPGSGWVVEDGALVRKTKAGDIWTRQRFGNFALALEFRTEGNSGVFIRTDNPKDNVQTGIEIQVDRPGGPGKHSVGAAYDLQAPTANVGTTHWNLMVITATGSRVQIELNGRGIVDMDLDRWTEPGKNPDGSKNKFKTALKDFKREGHIGFQDHGDGVAYRNVRIKPL